MTGPASSRLFAPEAVSDETRAFNEASGQGAATTSPTWGSKRCAAGADAQPPFSARPRPLHSRLRRASCDPGDRAGQSARADPHFHGGGLIFGSADAQDPMLERIAK